MTIRIKWNNLTEAQRKQVSDYYKEEIAKKELVINQYSYKVNPTDGNVIFHKDF